MIEVTTTFCGHYKHVNMTMHTNNHEHLACQNCFILMPAPNESLLSFFDAGSARKRITAFLQLLGRSHFSGCWCLLFCMSSPDSSTVFRGFDEESVR